MERKGLEMKAVRLATGLVAAVVCIMSGSCGRKESCETARLSLLADSWEIVSRQGVTSRLGTDVSYDTLPSLTNIEDGFTINFRSRLSEPTQDRCILEIPEVLEVVLRQHNPLDRSVQNYPAYKMSDGTVPVLEALLRLVSPVDGNVAVMRVGVPLAMLDRPFGEHDITLNFNGVQWTMYVDGKLVDNDFPFGYPDISKMCVWKADPEFVEDASIGFPASDIRRKSCKGASADLQYWTPAGFNAWVGDVVSLYADSIYHIFYLYDRRGHKSKFGRGGHYFEHLSTHDFIHWTEHESAVPIEEQWETFGTGTPFVADGHLCISYGYHTTRLYPYAQTTLPFMSESLKRNGHADTYDRKKLEGVAAGSSYSVSEDGVHFTKSGNLFHPCENPSIFVDSVGQLRMLANYGAKGTWTADSVNGQWRCVNENFPPGGDCTFFFSRGGYDYIIGGFANLWSKPSSASDSAYIDMVAAGKDFYNGICVPSITPISEGRCLMAGWMWLQEWGGALVIHELVGLPDGRIGTKWMEELVPATSDRHVKISEGEAVDVGASSFMLSFTVVPGVAMQGRIELELLPDESCGLQDGCEWRLDCAEGRAQYSGVGRRNAAEKSLREGGEPHRSPNYAIENLMGTDKPFEVRMIVKYSPKFDGSLVDAEIAGCRTMLSYRKKLEVARVRLNGVGLKITNVELKPLVVCPDSLQ